MAIIEIDESEFEQETQLAFDRGDIVILKFGSMYCDACMALGFELEELDEKIEKLTVLEIDTPRSEELAQLYDIVEVPTMKIYKDREHLIFDAVGVTLAVDIEQMINEG